MPSLGPGGRTGGWEPGDTERSSVSTTSSASSSHGATWTSTSANKLSKLGRRLRDSCRSLKPRGGGREGGRTDCTEWEPADYESVQLPSESIRSKVYVAMDFSNKSQGGRILENPRDVQSCSKTTLASKDGYLPFRRRVAASVADRLTETQATVHKLQPWYHGGMTRDKANKILQLHLNTDGVFLVRESSVAGGFVISFTAQSKNIHSQVLPISSPEGVLYSIDDGKTKFYDLLQLVEFHQLNTGCLPVRLQHYLACPEEKEKGGEKEKEGLDECQQQAVSRSSSSSSCPGVGPGLPQPSSPVSVKMVASEAASEADSAMSQDGGSDDEGSSREQQG